MFIRITIPFIAMLMTLAVTSYAQHMHSALQNGTWYKVAVAERGVYKITYDQLHRMGFNNVDPKKISVRGNVGGMLPQRNSAYAPDDLQEVAIFVAGEADGSFDPGDYILFFGEGPDRVTYDLSREIFSYENNLYADKNYYFITVSEEAGQRIGAINNLPGDYPIISTFDDYVYDEVDKTNILFSGREWVGQRFDIKPEHSVTVDISNIATDSDIKLVSDIVGQTYATAAVNLFWNNASIGTQELFPIPNTQYGIKGLHERDTLVFAAATVGALSTSQHVVKFNFSRAGSGSSNAYLDFFLACVKRNMVFSGQQMIFRSWESTKQSVSKYLVSQAPSDAVLWNITDPHGVRMQEFVRDEQRISFGAESGVLQEYVLFDQNVPLVEMVGEVPNQDIKQIPTPQLLIVTHSDFAPEAQRLATHREQHSGWNVAIVTTEQIYNQYSSGRQDVTAIRNFIRTLYDNDREKMKAVLLFGKASYDYKDRIESNTNFVPTYESRNSLSPLATYSSDDYFVFLESHEGEWNESPAQNHTLDLGVGRLPVKSLAEAKAVVDKIIYYDTNSKTYGSWRKTISFVGDDGNNSDNFTSSHQSQANAMSMSIDLSNPQFDTKKIFLGTFEKTIRPNGETIPEANDAIMETFDRGSLIVNFTGHGNEYQWADEKVFSDIEIATMKNKIYPFLVTATCEFGRQDDPRVISSAELIVLKNNGGAIGLVTTARPVNAGTNFLLNQEFYAALFAKDINGYKTLGEVFRDTKNNSMSGVSNRNFSLLADPSMTLAMPQSSIDAQILTVSGSDTLKGLSTVRLQGAVRNEYGEVDSEFNGNVHFTLYDKEAQVSTIGKNNPPFAFKEWSNILYRGNASVVDGIFDFQFVVTKNVDEEIAPGKLSLYAFDVKSRKDASGVLSSFKVGGMEPDVLADVTPPIIIPYMGDSTFESGGIVNTNSTLVVELSDDSGINISGHNEATTMVAFLDGDIKRYVLTDYYEAEKDDFKRGKVVFPLKGLEPGKHSITINAWDTHNNPGQATVEFVVTDGTEIVIETLGNFPNPFQSETSVFFTHNRPGDDLEARLTIYSSDGLLLKTYDLDVTESSYRVVMGEINDLNDLGKKLPPGLYLGRLVVRSLTNGSKNERVTKLIVVN